MVYTDNSAINNQLIDMGAEGTKIIFIVFIESSTKGIDTIHGYIIFVFIVKSMNIKRNVQIAEFAVETSEISNDAGAMNFQSTPLGIKLVFGMFSAAAF